MEGRVGKGVRGGECNDNNNIIIYIYIYFFFQAEDGIRDVRT